MGRLLAKRVAAAAAVLLLGGSPAFANRASDDLRARAIRDLFNLDRDQAIATYRDAIAADPDDAAAYRGLASALWLTITADRGNMTVDDYLGKLSRSDLQLPPPKPEDLAAFRDAVDHALALGRKHVASNPRDAESHFQLGAAVALRASYIVTVDGSVLGAFRAAREAFNEHEEVLKLDPKRADAGLVVGTYRYVVSVLALPLRWVAYIAGFGGDRDKALRLIEGAAEYPGENQTDARLALVLLYNREQRYDAALAELARLREEYPRNRLLLFETGATYLRGGHAADAERIFNDGIARFNADPAARMFGEEALWYYKRGFAREIIGRTADAEQDLRKAIAAEGRGWVHGRAHLELGKVLFFTGNRAGANTELRQAVMLCDSDNDAGSADEARRWIAQK
jgi:tetratricopeptide (TPR) repeat protein